MVLQNNLDPVSLAGQAGMPLGERDSFWFDEGWLFEHHIMDPIHEASPITIALKSSPSRAGLAGDSIIHMIVIDTSFGGKISLG